MITLLILCWSFIKTGLFAVGGGLATIPFLYEMSDIHPEWFSHADILNMLAISESTPGPIGVNMATYSGYSVMHSLTGNFFASFGGGIAATLSLALPSVVVILIVAKILDKFRNNRFVTGAFYVLRPASTALIASAGLGVIFAVFFDVEDISFATFGKLGEGFTHVNWQMLILFAVIFVLMRLKPFKKVHPIAFIAFSALVGIIFKF